MRARDAVRRVLATVEPEVTVAHAARVMVASEARTVVVAEEGRVVGVLTEGDIVARVVSRQLAWSTPVRTVMTPEPVTLPATASALQAYAVLREHGLGQLPLVEERKVVALLELDDLVSESTGDALAAYGQCPHCGGTPLRVVTDGQASNLLCLGCRQCWRPERGRLVRVHPDYCPGCPDRLFCRFPAVDR